MDKVTSILSKEVQLVLYGIHKRIDADIKNHILNLIDSGIDWSEVHEVAIFHQVVPLLYYNLNKVMPDKVPADIMAELKEDYEANSYSSLLLTGELKRLLDLLDSYDIEAVPIKGPTIARLYENYMARTVGDLDIWVNKQEIIKTKQILIEDGYTPSINFSGSQEAVWIKSGMGYDFMKRRDRFMVDVHSNITSGNSTILLPEDTIRSNLRNISFMGMEMKNPSPEYTLIFLCIHGTKHLWEFLKLVCDLAEFVDHHKDLDWNWTLQEAKRLGGKRTVLTSLWIVNQLVDLELSELVLADIARDPLVKKIGTRIITQWMFGIKITPFQVSVIKIQLHDSLGSFVNYMIRLIFIPRYQDIIPLPVPSSLYFVYFLLRPIFLVKGAVSAVFRKLTSPFRK